MKTYACFDDAWCSMLLRTMEFGELLHSRNGQSTELVGESFKLTDIDRNVLQNPRRNMSLKYACAELIWYLSRDLSVDRIQHYAPQYEKFANENLVHGAYGHRIESGHCGDQLAQVVDLLREQPNTRQALIQLWHPRDLWFSLNHPRNDVPCTICIQFMLRDGALHMIVYMRSNDLWLGTPYDVFCFTSLQKLVADLLCASYGTYTHNVGSLHFYLKNENAIHEVWPSYGDTVGHLRSTTDQVSNAVDSEECSRKCYLDLYIENMEQGTLLHDVCLVLKDQQAYSPVFKGMQDANSRGN